MTDGIQQRGKMFCEAAGVKRGSVLNMQKEICLRNTNISAGTDYLSQLNVSLSQD